MSSVNLLILSRPRSSVMLVAYSILAIASLSVAQDLGVPLSWRVRPPNPFISLTTHPSQKFSNTRPKSERITISANALNSILGQLNTGTAEFNGIGFWQSGNVFSVLANHDRLAGVTTYRDRTLNGLNTAFRLNANYDRFQVRAFPRCRMDADDHGSSMTMRCGGLSRPSTPIKPMESVSSPSRQPTYSLASGH